MKIGIFGIIIIFLSIFLIRKPSNLLFAAVFFAPYTECSVISFSSFFLQPGHYFLLLYLVVLLAKSNTHKKLYISLVPNVFLLLFIIVSFFSIILAYVFQKDIMVYGIGNGVELTHSKVDLQNITQFIYLFSGYVFLVCIVSFINSGEDKLYTVIKISMASAISILLISLYQLIAAQFNLPYSEIFRNDRHPMWQEMTRVQATFGEASYLSQYLVFALVLFLFYETKQYKRILFFVLYFFIGVLTRSSTFFLGTVFAIAFYLMLKRPTIKNVFQSLLIIVLSVLAFNFLYNNNDKVNVLVNNTLLKFRLQTISGIERYNVLKYTLKIGFTYPIFGIGYGGGRSTDFFASVFLQTGITGVIVIISFLSSLIFPLINHINLNESKPALLLVSIFIVTSMSVSDIHFLHFWLIMAICICISDRLKKSYKLKKEI